MYYKIMIELNKDEFILDTLPIVQFYVQREKHALVWKKAWDTFY